MLSDTSKLWSDMFVKLKQRRSDMLPDPTKLELGMVVRPKHLGYGMVCQTQGVWVQHSCCCYYHNHNHKLLLTIIIIVVVVVMIIQVNMSLTCCQTQLNLDQARLSDLSTLVVAWFVRPKTLGPDMVVVVIYITITITITINYYYYYY